MLITRSRDREAVLLCGQSITLISIVIPNYWNADFSMIAGFQSVLAYN